MNYSFTDRRLSQIANEYLSEYGTVEAAQNAVIHGGELESEAAERVCCKIEEIGEQGSRG
jgi:anti-sigma regulatory factor (Ser/Thr protein kinase)